MWSEYLTMLVFSIVHQHMKSANIFFPLEIAGLDLNTRKDLMLNSDLRDLRESRPLMQCKKQGVTLKSYIVSDIRLLEKPSQRKTS